MEPTGRVLVPFHGEGEGVEEMTWGQREIWAPFELAGRSIGMGGTMVLPAGATVDDFVAVLRFSVGRHQALRTRFRCDADGRPRQQVVASSGEVALDIFDVDDADDPGEYAAALRWQYEGKDFDYANEWPIRMGVVRHRGVPTHAVVMYCHLVIDGYGLDALTRDVVGNLDRAMGLAGPPVASEQPLDQARYQNSPAGRAHSESALRYWERLLRDVPARRSAGSSDPRSPRYWGAGLNSPAMHMAVRTIAHRTRVDTSPVLLAAFSVSLARVTGVNPTVVRSVVSNRFRPGFAESVSAVNQTGLCVIDVADATFDEVVRRAWRSAMGAGLHAYYDPVGLKDLLARMSRERGEEMDVACFFNDARRSRDPAGAESTADETREALGRTTFRWVHQQDHPSERLFLTSNEVPDTIDLALAADTHHVAPADIEACLRDMESIVVDAATDPGARTGIGTVSAHG